jgi:hypothetical protein
MLDDRQTWDHNIKTTYDISLDPAVIKITSQVSFRCSPEPKDLLFNDASGITLTFPLVTPSLVPAELKVLHGCYWRRENRNVTPRNKKRILKIGQVSCFFFFLVFSFGVVVFLLLK